jgi:hypothetical protein
VSHAPGFFQESLEGKFISAIAAGEEGGVGAVEPAASLDLFQAGDRWGLMIQLHQCIMTTMRTTVTLDDDVYEAAQAHAQATGKRLGQVLSEMARQVLQPSGQRPRRSVKRASRFPAFEVPAGAGLIPASRVQKALDEDGIA